MKDKGFNVHVICAMIIPSSLQMLERHEHLGVTIHTIRYHEQMRSVHSLGCHFV